MQVAQEVPEAMTVADDTQLHTLKLLSRKATVPVLVQLPCRCCRLLPSSFASDFRTELFDMQPPMRVVTKLIYADQVVGSVSVGRITDGVGCQPAHTLCNRGWFPPITPVTQMLGYQ